MVLKSMFSRGVLYRQGWERQGLNRQDIDIGHVYMCMYENLHDIIETFRWYTQIHVACTDGTQINLRKRSLVKTRSTSNQSSKPCTVLQYPSQAKSGLYRHSHDTCKYMWLVDSCGRISRPRILPRLWLSTLNEGARHDIFLHKPCRQRSPRLRCLYEAQAPVTPSTHDTSDTPNVTGEGHPRAP